MNADTIKFLKQLGYASKSHWSKYLGGTPVTDSLLGIKYIISDKDLSHHHTAQFTEGDYTVYLNANALSLAYGVTPAIVDVNTEDHDTPFARVNELVSAMIGETVEIYTPVEAFDTSMVNMEETYIASHLKYTAVNSNREATLYYEFTAPMNGAEYYLYIPSDYPREMKLKVNGADNGTFYGNETTRIVSVGSDFAAGDTIKVGLSLVKPETYIKDEGFCLYYIDYATYEYAISRLKEVQFNIESYTEDSFYGTIFAPTDTQTILTTIPYDEGWKITVDGEEIEYFETLDALITFVIDAGEHEVTMEYRPESYRVGMTSTAVCSVLFLLLCLLDLITRKKTGKPFPFIGGINDAKEEAKEEFDMFENIILDDEISQEEPEKKEE